MPASGSPERSDRAVALINGLLAASAETASVEFKENNSAPVLIGKYISALANAAALEEEFTGIFASEWARALFATSPEIERRAVRFARLTIAFHVAGLGIAVVLGAWWLPIVVTGSVFVGRWLFDLVVLPQHFGLMDSVPDFRMTTRSIKLNPFTSFLYWRMNWHAEHHMFAGVPCYHLKQLAKAITPDMPRLRTLWQAWGEMIQSGKRQQQDPTYQYQTPLPPTAHPAVLSDAVVVLPEGERLAAEASIGDLARQRH